MPLDVFLERQQHGIQIITQSQQKGRKILFSYLLLMPTGCGRACENAEAKPAESPLSAALKGTLLLQTSPLPVEEPQQLFKQFSMSPGANKNYQPMLAAIVNLTT